MYVRDAKNREEVWLLDRLEELDLEDPAFRSRDYVVAVEEVSHEKAGFGRIRIHPGDPEVCELTAVGVLPAWRNQGVGAHIIERLIDHAGDQGFDRVYVITTQVEYVRQFGFEPADRADLPEPIRTRLVDRRTEDEEAIAMMIVVGNFSMPDRLREAFKLAGKREVATDTEDATGESGAGPEEDFGIDTENATYKYDTGR